MPQNQIEIKNACVHNLKHVDVQIPHNQLVVITGLSGSGKSSLAFDTLYAEGQRRYVESLSAYIRQFLGRMNKPEVDYIKGLPPAIAIEQKVISSNPRSTVGTSTEIYDYIKLLYARIGHTFSPVSGNEVQKHSVDDVADFILKQPDGTTVFLETVVAWHPNEPLAKHLEMLNQQGFSRVEIEGQFYRINDVIEKKELQKYPQKIRLVIDRIVLDYKALKEISNRLSDSIETAFFEGKDACEVVTEHEGKIKRHLFSKAFEADGLRFEEPTEQMFSFNNPAGACPVCEGFGKIIGIDPDLVIPNKNLSIYDEAVFCWRGEKMSEWNKELIYNADKFNFPIHKPYNRLTSEQQHLLWTGNEYFHGINDFFKWVENQQYKIQYRVMLARYRGKTVCPECGGTRLKKEASWVKVGGVSIPELVNMPISELAVFFSTLKLSKQEQLSSKRLLTEINMRIDFLMRVGLSYLTLNRQSNTLSGGESQRINLAKSLGSSLVGSLYVLDEPSIGLHGRDTTQLIGVLKQLRDLGNTVVVVEHDELIMRAADYIIDIGPGAGRMGGEVLFQSPISQLKTVKCKNSHTLNFLLGKESIDLPVARRKWSNYIEVTGASQNNLKNINVKFPLNILTVVTGVSGSGKSSLVRDVLFSKLKRKLNGAEDKGLSDDIKGSLHLVSDIEFVNQSPIGKSSRSNPVTYLKVYDEIRRLFAELPYSKQMGFTPATFSFNVDGGRCDACQGDGTITVEMQFMADLVLTCDVCHGKRFKSDVLEARYRDQNIYDVLEMTVNQAVEFFSTDANPVAQRIVKRLKPLQDVGIGYLKLGQPSSTLSGGENQRVKLASFLVEDFNTSTLFIFDEPTTGLHTYDIKVLLKAFNNLIANGHTVVVIEHNIEIIKSADYVIDLGPEGGDNGGHIVCEGTPETIAQCPQSYTGALLKELLL